jgi:hypothetical protein
MIVDPATGIVGQVPKYQALKNTHRDKLNPYFCAFKSFTTAATPRAEKEDIPV